MPDLGHEVKDFAVYTWRLTNWRKLEKKLTSPEFECGGHRWYAAISSLESLSFHLEALVQANTIVSFWKLKRATERHRIGVP